MHTQLKHSTIVIALVTVALIFVTRLPIRGIWTIYWFAPTLWCFWIGWVLATCRPVGLKKKIGFAALICAMIAGGGLLERVYLFELFQDSYWLLPGWRFIIFSILGWTMGGNDIGKETEDYGKLSDVFMFIACAFIYAWTVLTKQYVGYCSHIPNAYALVRLCPALKYIEYLPLLGAVWYGSKCAQSNVIYRLLSIKWIRMTCIVLAVVLGLFDILISLTPYRKIMIIFNPLLAYAVAVIVNAFRCFSIRPGWDWKRIFMIKGISHH